MALDLVLHDPETTRILLTSQLPALEQCLARLDAARFIPEELIREPFGPKDYRSWDELRDAKAQYR